jgi:rubrerythrin
MPAILPLSKSLAIRGRLRASPGGETPYRAGKAVDDQVRGAGAEDKSASFVSVPETLAAAVKASAEAEKNTMRMYASSLKQQLPEDVKLIFTLLRSASARHSRP